MTAFVRALLYATFCVVFVALYVVTDKVDALILAAWFGVMSKLEGMDRP